MKVTLGLALIIGLGALSGSGLDSLVNARTTAIDGVVLLESHAACAVSGGGCGCCYKTQTETNPTGCCGKCKHNAQAFTTGKKGCGTNTTAKCCCWYCVGCGCGFKKTCGTYNYATSCK
jgi:hypothetical protein